MARDTDTDTDTEEEEGSSGGGGGFQIEVLKSYLAFVRRALKNRWLVSSIVVAIGVVLTTLVFLYMPRRFNCTTVLMAEQNLILDGANVGYALTGAGPLVMRHENLVALVKELKLNERAAERRPPLLRLKNQIAEAIRGPTSEEAKTAINVGTLESRLIVNIDGDGNLRVSADWTDGQTAAEIARAARDSFIRARHNSEFSAFNEKMAILDGHATKLREEVETVAEQIKTQRGKQPAPAPRPATAPGAGAAPAPVAALRSAPARRPAVDEQLPVLKQKLEAERQKLSALENDHEQRVREERRKLEELKLKLTPSHPEVMTQQQRTNMVAQIPSEMILKRTEVAQLETEIKQRDALSRTQIGGLTGGGRTATAAGAEPLPTDIMSLLQEGDTDPILATQLSGAAMKYAALRDDIRSHRIAIDEAQAAFNHRYKEVVPASVPSLPYAPKPAVLIGAGLLITLLLALILPIILELRTGIIVERWQVQLVDLPVLAELHLPPHSAD